MTSAGPAPGAPLDPALAGAFRIDRDGAWCHEGVEVTHPGVLRNLYANLRVEGDRHHLQAGPLRIPVQVDDAPFVVLRVDSADEPDAMVLHLSDGTRERLDEATLSVDPRGVPHCRVKDGQFRARLSVPAWLQLAGRIEADPAGGPPALVLGTRRSPVRREE